MSRTDVTRHFSPFSSRAMYKCVQYPPKRVPGFNLLLLIISQSDRTWSSLTMATYSESIPQATECVASTCSTFLNTTLNNHPNSTNHYEKYSNIYDLDTKTTLAIVFSVIFGSVMLYFIFRALGALWRVRRVKKQEHRAQDAEATVRGEWRLRDPETWRQGVLRMHV